jgi:hypothetical protein
MEIMCKSQAQVAKRIFSSLSRWWSNRPSEGCTKGRAFSEGFAAEDDQELTRELFLNKAFNVVEDSIRRHTSSEGTILLNHLFLGTKPLFF